MNSNAKIGFWIGASLTMGFLFFVFIGMTLDESLPIYSKGWFVFAVVLILLTLLFTISYLKIPTIKIVGNQIHYKALNINTTFYKTDIIELAQINANINSWYSFRGGIKIITKNGVYEFPFHFYPNESELLQELYGTQPYQVDLVNNYSPSYLSYMQYFYKNSHTIYLLMSMAFTWLALTKTNALSGKIIFGIMGLITIFPFLMSSHYVKLDNNELVIIHPLLLRSTKIKVKDIESANTKPIYAGKGGSIKHITLTLNNKRIKTIRAGFNWQSELDLIVDNINAKS